MIISNTILVLNLVYVMHVCKENAHKKVQHENIAILIQISASVNLDKP